MTDAETAETEDLDAKLRRVDPHRWLSSRFVADKAARTDLLALYAFDHELARIPGSTKQAMLGEIRLAWWREGLDEVFAGRSARAHPTLQALAEVITRRDLPRAPLEAILDARIRELDAEPLADGAELDAWLDAAHGSVMALAVRLLDPDADVALVENAARAWGVGVMARNGRIVPVSWGTHDAEGRRLDYLRLARPQAARLPAATFPAVAHAALSGRRGRGTLASQLKMVGSVATGRI